MSNEGPIKNPIDSSKSESMHGIEHSNTPPQPTQELPPVIHIIHLNICISNHSI